MLTEEHQAQSDTIVQAETSEAIAELRELYRLVRMFPFYQYKARNTLADQLTSQLKGCAKVRTCLTRASTGACKSRISNASFDRSQKRARLLRSMKRSTCFTSTTCTTSGCAWPAKGISTSDTGRCHSLNSAWHGR